MQSQRADKRGHWPAGRRRHADVRPPRGWPDLPTFLASVREYCQAHRGRRGHAGAHQELADRLGVHFSALSAWLSGRKWPGQVRVDAMATWLRERRRADHPGRNR